MSTGNGRIPDKDALLRFANSDTGKDLLKRLDVSDPHEIQRAAQKASEGDIAGALQILQALLSSSDGSGNKEGSHGKRS